MIQIIESGNDVAITRRVASDGTKVKGVFVEASAPDPFVVKAAIQPKTGIELLALDKGEREKIHLDVFTLERLEIHDEFSFGGKKYDIQNVHKFYKHFESIAVEKKI